MTNKEVLEEHDRRLDAIYEEYAVAVRAYEAATKRKDEARQKLKVWLGENYKGPKDDEWVVTL